MRRILIVLIASIMSCGCIPSDKKFIKTSRIGITPLEKHLVYYDLYKTGYDNFVYDFKILNPRDSSTRKLATFFLNDVKYEKVRFSSFTYSDTIEVYYNWPFDCKIDDQIKDRIKLVLIQTISADTSQLQFGIKEGDPIFTQPKKWDSLLIEMNDYHRKNIAN